MLNSIILLERFEFSTFRNYMLSPIESTYWKTCSSYRVFGLSSVSVLECSEAETP